MSFMEENQMRIGDLVELSAYGKKVKRASWINTNDVGIITKIVRYKNYQGDQSEEYLIFWRDSRSNPRRWAHERHNQRSDLKYARPR